MPIAYNRAERITNSIKYVILSIGLIIMVLPLVWMILASFMTEAEISRIPPKWIPKYFDFSNYEKVLTMVPVGRFYFNTLLLAVVSVFSVLLTSSLAGFVFAKHNVVGVKVTFYIFLSTMMLPHFVLFIPLYISMAKIGLINTYTGLIAPSLANTFCIFLMRQHLLGIPNDLLDAARIDGASEFKIYYLIIIPLSKSILGTIAIFVFMWNWNAFLWPLIITNEMTMRVINVGIALFSTQYVSLPHLSMALNVLAVFPVIIVFLLMQRQFIKAMVTSGMK